MFICLLLAFCQSALAIDINKYLSATWWNANQNGHGYNIQVVDANTVLIFWYVYHPDGTPLFLLGVGDINGNVTEGKVFYQSGMKFGEFNPDDLQQEEWGTFKITFHSCGSATFEYSSTMQHMGVAFGSGAIPLTRFLGIVELQCSDVPQAGLYQGNFYSEATGQVIPGLAVLAPNGDLVALSYDGIAAFGSWVLKGVGISGSGTAISVDPGFYFKSDFTLNGAIAVDHRLVADYSVFGGDYGRADLFATPALYRRGVRLADTAGSYIGTNLATGFDGTATVSGNGSISGSDDGGCQYSGKFQVPDKIFNLMTVSLQVSGCGVVNGGYSGYAMVDDHQFFGDGRKILLVATNGTYAAVIEMVR